MSALVIVAVVLVMLAGLAGSVLTVIPGHLIIWLGYLGYGFYDHWESYGLVTMIVTGAVVALTFVLDQVASAWGTKRLGGSVAGMIGYIVGGIVGLVVLSLPGLVLGAFGGAVAFEMLFSGQKFKESAEAGAGALLGLLCGGLAKFVIAAAMIMAFAWLALFG